LFEAAGDNREEADAVDDALYALRALRNCLKMKTSELEAAWKFSRRSAKSGTLFCRERCQVCFCTYVFSLALLSRHWLEPTGAAPYRHRAAEAFTSEQNMLRCLRMHRIC
jgi:hypothetical protein